MQATAKTYVQADPHNLFPGLPLIFRNAGTGPVRNVVVAPRGPLGQCMVHFVDGNFTLAVNERELFTLA